MQINRSLTIFSILLAFSIFGAVYPVAAEVEIDQIWLTDAAGGSGSSLQVELRMENDINSVDAFTIYVSYDPDMLSFESCETGDIQPSGGWTYFGCHNPDRPGNLIKILGMHFSDEVPSGSYGKLAVLNFTVTCDSCVNGDASMFRIQALWDDVQGFEAADGRFVFTGGDPTPTPTIPPIPSVNASGIFAILSLFTLLFLMRFSRRKSLRP